MKCNCGFEEKWNAEKAVFEGGYQFIPSELKLSYETDGNYYRNMNSAVVYICPKCGTLKINL